MLKHAKLATRLGLSFGVVLVLTLSLRLSGFFGFDNLIRKVEQSDQAGTLFQHIRQAREYEQTFIAENKSDRFVELTKSQRQAKATMLASADTVLNTAEAADTPLQVENQGGKSPDHGANELESEQDTGTRQ